MTTSFRARLKRVLKRTFGTPPVQYPRPMVFVHIPKTAGTAFSHYLRQHCSAGGRMMETFYGDYSIYDGVDDASLIMGHTFYRDMQVRFPQASFVTWLRDPVKRIISQYKSWHDPKKLHQHWRDNVADHDFRFGHIFWTQTVDFNEFAMSNDGRIINNISNTQTEILASVSPRKDPQAALASAIENIERQIAFLGIVERFDESMGLFQRTFGIPTPYREEEGKANRSIEIKVEPSQRSLDRIMELNTLDFVLYDHARKLLENRLNEKPGRRMMRRAA